MDFEARNATIRSWCVDQLAVWKTRRINTQTAMEIYTHLNETRESAVLYNIEDGEVSVADKPATFPDGRLMDASPFADRARIYRDFFQHVLRAKRPDGNGVIMMEMHDGFMPIDSVPTFAFQKTDESNSILINDVDMIVNKYYIHEQDDAQVFLSKRDAAVFAGGTSGMAHTCKSVANLEGERLRSGVYFKDIADVDFNLPLIVQCIEPGAEDMIRALGFGGALIPWSEQRLYKFLISLDGNGATCSRVAMALKSNSVLMKYDSPHKLHYFRSLQPWLHYIPISSRTEVEPLIEIERRQQGYFQYIADAGTKFADTFLDLDANMTYAAALMEMYFGSFDRGVAAPGWHAPDTEAPRACESSRVFGLAHIAGIGDVWASSDKTFGTPGSGVAIEGFALYPKGELAPVDIECAAVNESGQGPWRVGGRFCGSAGAGIPLLGVLVRLRGQAAQRFICLVTATFVGAQAEQSVEGTSCEMISDTPLESFTIVLKPITAAVDPAEVSQEPTSSHGMAPSH